MDICMTQMSIRQCCFIPILLSILFYKDVFSESADIKATLLDFNLQDGNTKCERYFLINDTIELKASIVWKEDIKLHPNDGIFIYKSSDLNASFEFFYYQRFGDCKGLNKLLRMSCSLSNSSAETQLILTASKTLSQKYIRLYVNNTKNACESNVRRIPRIFEFPDIKMICNNKTLDGNVTTVYLPMDVTELHVCCVDAPDPCFPVISSYTKDILNKSRTCVTYTRKLSDTKFLIGFDVCNNTVQYPFQVFISNETETRNTTTNDDGSVIKWAIGGSIAGSILIGVVIFVILKIICKRCRKKKDEAKQKEKMEMIPKDDTLLR